MQTWRCSWNFGCKSVLTKAKKDDPTRPLKFKYYRIIMQCYKLPVNKTMLLLRTDWAHGFTLPVHSHRNCPSHNGKDFKCKLKCLSRLSSIILTTDKHIQGDFYILVRKWEGIKHEERTSADAHRDRWSCKDALDKCSEAWRSGCTSNSSSSMSLLHSFCRALGRWEGICFFISSDFF